MKTLRFASFNLFFILLAIILIFINYKNFWGKTIRHVETVEFNMLSHSLPTKVSYALINNDLDEIRKTLASNYSFFSLAVTDCKEDRKQCKNQKIWNQQ